jgi:hypothetical protein
LIQDVPKQDSRVLLAYGRGIRLLHPVWSFSLDKAAGHAAKIPDKIFAQYLGLIEEF